MMLRPIQELMQTVFLALGSNEGDRLDHFRFAVEELARCGVATEAKSKIYASQSVGSGGEGDFLNAVLRARTELSAQQLLEVCLQIESLAGRRLPEGEGAKREGSRALDVDILLFGDEEWNTPSLQVPHPRALTRAFVLRPLLDVLPGGWVAESDLDW